MDKFITTAAGGMPLNNNDFGFIQDAWREGFQAAYSKHGETPSTAIILAGIVRTDGGANWDYTAGFAYMNGEVLRFAAASPAKEGGGEAHYLVLDSTDASTGTKLYENGLTFETHNERKAVITNYTIGSQPANSILYTDINVRRVLTDLDEPWVPVTVFNGDNTDVNLRVRKLAGMVHIHGAWNDVTGNGFTLPVGYRPDISMTGQFVGTAVTGDFVIAWTIETSGLVYVGGGPAAGVSSLHVSFPLVTL